MLILDIIHQYEMLLMNLKCYIILILFKTVSASLILNVGTTVSSFKPTLYLLSDT